MLAVKGFAVLLAFKKAFKLRTCADFAKSAKMTYRHEMLVVFSPPPLQIKTECVLSKLLSFFHPGFLPDVLHMTHWRKLFHLRNQLA